MNQARHSRKIFGIGLSKTGTTSLANALQILGYRTRDNMGVTNYAAGELSSVDLDPVDSYDAVTDTPIPSFFRELDARYPGSKFILTVRGREGWLRSCQKQFTLKHAQHQSDAHRRLFTDLYGTDVFEEESFASGYERFIAAVAEYFKHRPGDLLTIDVTAGEGWEKLCPFLGRAQPDVPFPKANVTQVRWIDIQDVVGIARQAGAVLMRSYRGESSSGLPASAASRTRTASRVTAVLERAVQAMRVRDPVGAAREAAHHLIVKELRRLTPEIPVLSRAGAADSPGKRRQWNHVWLVDPLDGERAFAAGEPRFSVDIALVEDGKPIYGVVAAPAMRTAYFGRLGKSAFKVEGDGEPRPLQSQGERDRGLSADRPDPASDHGSIRESPESSCGLALCRVAEGAANAESIAQPTMEWETAAAQVVLNGAGLQLRSQASGTVLAYNKRELANDRFVVS